MFNLYNFAPIKNIITLLLVVVLSSSCAEHEKQLVDKVKQDYIELPIQTLLFGGVEREYVLYIPHSYNGTEEVPLMLNFHGFGGSANHFLNVADMRQIADSESFILVYPQGTLLDGYSHWNAGLDSPENKSSANDFGFVEALLDELSKNYAIDQTKVYASGFSNGAFFAYALACFLNDRITAIASVAGTMLTETHENCSPSYPIAMLNIHGTSDSVVPYNGGEGLNSISSVITYWTNYNSSNTETSKTIVTENNLIIEHFIYKNEQNGIAIEHYKVIDGGHDWFDFNHNGKNINQIIWEFVSKF